MIVRSILSLVTCHCLLLRDMSTSSESKLSPHAVELAAQALNAPATELAITQLTGDASTRTYFRAQAKDAPVIVSIYAEPFDETERVESRLAKMEAANPAARLTFANDPCAHIEVTELFLKAGLPVPRLISASGRDRALLFEDVGDVRLQDWIADHTPTQIADAYRKAVDLIVKIQEATELAVSTGSICSKIAFDEAKLRWELGFFFANYFNRYLGLKLDAATANGVQQDFKTLCSELAARPRVLVHRDYHARNLMMVGDDMFIIDHQDARMGPASYDLASLVSDPYTALESELSAELIGRFIEGKAASTAPLSDAEEFCVELELMTIQRMLKAVGTYSYQTAVVNNLTYVDYIEPAIERSIVSISALSRFDNLRALLERAREIRPAGA